MSHATVVRGAERAIAEQVAALPAKLREQWTAKFVAVRDRAKVEFLFTQNLPAGTRATEEVTHGTVRLVLEAESDLNSDTTGATGI